MGSSQLGEPQQERAASGYVGGYGSGRESGSGAGAVVGAGAEAVAVAGAAAGVGAVAVAVVGAVAGAGAVAVVVAVQSVGYVPEHGCVRSGGGSRSVGRSVVRVPQHGYGYG